MSEKKTINQKIKELDEKTGWFYSDDFSLSESAEKYKDAMELAKEIKDDLKDLRNEIEILDKDFTK